MHLRALLSGAILLTAAAAAQDAPQTCQASKACDQAKAKAVVVSVKADDGACASTQSCTAKASPVGVVAGDCASGKAAPVALVKAADGTCASACASAAPVAIATGCAASECAATASPSALPVALSVAGDDEDIKQLQVELQDLTISVEGLELGVDLQELLKDLDLSELGGHIAIKVNGAGDYEVLDSADLAGLNIDLALPVVDVAIEGDDEILSELSALGYLADDEGGERGYLGVQMSLEGGLNVLGVLPGSGAAKAGLKEGDTIVSVNGKSTKEEGITEYLQSLEAGDTVKVVYARKDSDKLKKTKIKLMTLEAIEGGAEEPEEIEEEIELPARGRIQLQHDGDDFNELRAHVKDVVLQEIEGGESHGMRRHIALATPEGDERRVVLHGHSGAIELDDVTKGTITIVGDGSGDGHGVHVFKAQGGQGGRMLRLSPDASQGDRHITVRVDATAEPSQGFFFDATSGHQHDADDHAQGKRRVVVKRVENGEESVEEYSFGDGEGIPDHIRERLHEHADTGDGVRRMRVRSEGADTSHDHDVEIHRAHGGAVGNGRVVIKTSINGNEDVEEFAFGGDDLPEHVRRLLEEHNVQLHGLGDGGKRQIRIRKGGDGGHDVEKDVVIIRGDGQGGAVGKWIAEAHQGGDMPEGVWTTRIGRNHVLHMTDDHDEHEHEAHDHDGHNDDAHGQHGIFEFRGPDGARGRALLRIRTDNGHGASIGLDAKGLHKHLAEALKAHGIHGGGDHADAIHGLLKQHLGEIDIEIDGSHGMLGLDARGLGERLRSRFGNQERRDGARNRLFLGGSGTLRGFDFRGMTEHEVDDDEDVDELLEEIEELHERIDRLEATIERLGRRRR